MYGVTTNMRLVFFHVGTVLNLDQEELKLTS